jgi:hypothetical protein
MFLALLYLIFAIYKLTNTAADPDLWGYMAFGRLFWESDKFPYKDVFAYLPTLDLWVYHEWLTGALFFPLYQKFGASALQLLKYCIGLGTMGLIYLTALRRGANAYATILVLCSISSILNFGYSPVRAQIFTFFFFALSLYVLETARLTKRWNSLWYLIPMQMLWCNLHGGFLVGLGLIGFYIIGEALARKPFIPYIMALVFSMLATLINPYGIEYWRFFVRSLPMSRPELIEWASVYTAYKYGLMSNAALLSIFFIIILLVLLLVWLKPREYTSLIGLGLMFFLGVTQQRHICFFMLLTGAYLPAWLAAFFKAMEVGPIIQWIQQRINWKIPAMISVILIFLLGVKIIRQDPLSLRLSSTQDRNNKFIAHYPVDAVAYIKEHVLLGKLLAEFSWGEYLIWSLSPQCRISLDGRYEQVYTESISREYFNFLFCREGWRNFLTRYPPDMILIKKGSKLYDALSTEPGWKQAYHDSGAALFLPHS